METVEQLQDLTNTLDEEMKRFKQQEDEQTIKDWKANMTQLNQVHVSSFYCIYKAFGCLHLGTKKLIYFRFINCLVSTTPENQVAVLTTL